jgi:hypothetical protein
MPVKPGPARWDHELIIGDSYLPAMFVAWEDEDKTVRADITGATGVWMIKSEPGGLVLLSGAVTLDDAAEGEFSWGQPDKTLTSALAPQTAEYCVRMTWANGTGDTVAEGRVVIRPPMGG